MKMKKRKEQTSRKDISKSSKSLFNSEKLKKKLKKIRNRTRIRSNKLGISKTGANIDQHLKSTSKVTGNVLEKQKDINSRTIFVGNLPKSATRKNLKKFFSQYGEVESTRIRCSALNFSFMPRSIAVDKKQFHEKATSLFGFVKFIKKDSAAEAEKANGTLFEENYLRVNRVDSIGSDQDTRNTIFIGNLPFDVAENTVTKLFEQCGDIESIRIIRDKETGIGKGFGYVNFKSPDSVELGLKLSGALLNKRAVRVTRSIKKFANKRKNERTETTSTQEIKSNKSVNANKTSDTVTPKRPKKKKNNDGKPKSFQGRTAKDKVVKKKSKKKLQKEFKKKKLVEILTKG